MFDDNLLSKIGNWSSIIGFLLTLMLSIITFFINRKIKTIQLRILSDKRLPDLVKQLEKNALKYSNYHKNYDNSIEKIQYEISQTLAILQLIRNKIQKSETKRIGNLIRKIEDMNSGLFVKEKGRKKTFLDRFNNGFKKDYTYSKEDVLELYNNLSGEVTQLHNLMEDLKVNTYE